MSERSTRALLALSTGLALVATLAWAGCGKDKQDPPLGDSGGGIDDSREPCAVVEEHGQLLWGDLHVHTALSFDAWVYDVRVDPDAATRFAKGEALLLPPLDDDGVGTRSLQLERPLDFVAITEHADLMGEVAGCTTPGTSAYESELCTGYREASQASIQAIATVLASDEPVRNEQVCGHEDFDCEAAAGEAWGQLQEVAEAHYDRSSDCGFTTFVGYEWTGATGISNYHRNVIFRTATVPEVPTTYFDEATAQGLWDALQRDCLDHDACDVIAIPHNSDMSNGQQFDPVYPGANGVEAEAEAAAQRVAMEPLIEIYQHKGDAECRPGGFDSILGSADELCAFEKQREDDAEDCGDEPGAGGMAGFGCVSRNDYLRGILLTGLEEEERLGVNPYELGVTASTDTHSGTPGYVVEDGWLGHLGGFEDDAEERLSAPGLTPGGYSNSGGGLVGAWAASNDRDALFEAFRRREVYGTSGPRLAVRFYGGPEVDPEICDSAQLVDEAASSGVPMGGRLPSGSSSTAPTFVVQALMDAGTEASPGVPLERVQIVKGWLDADGQQHVSVVDVAGGDLEAGVDTETCEPTGEGHSELCGTWTDPDWDPDNRAWYYARVLQNPTCRWSTGDCNSYDEAERPEVCDDGTLAETIQERAWTSPIFSQR